MIFCVVMVNFSGPAMRNSGDHGKNDFSDTFWWGSVAEVNNLGDRKVIIFVPKVLRSNSYRKITHCHFFNALISRMSSKGTTYPEMVLDGRDLSSLQKYVFLSAFSFLRQSSPLRFPMGIFFSLLALTTTIDGSEPGVLSWRCGSRSSLNCKFNMHPQLFDTYEQLFQFAFSDSVTRDVFEMVCCGFHFI